MTWDDITLAKYPLLGKTYETTRDGHLVRGNAGSYDSQRGKYRVMRDDTHGWILVSAHELTNYWREVTDD